MTATPGRRRPRQMCGGGTWRRADLTRLRRTADGSVVWDFAGWGLLAPPAGPLRLRLSGRFRAWAAEKRWWYLEGRHEGGTCAHLEWYGDCRHGCEAPAPPPLWRRLLPWSA